VERGGNVRTFHVPVRQGYRDQNREGDEVPFPDRFAALKVQLEWQFMEADKLTATIREKFAGIIVDG
jgi:hypothetical protein